MNGHSKRSFIIIAIFAVIVFAYLVKLFRLQVLDSSYKQFAARNVLRELVQYPARGLIYDRNGELLVYNKAAYDLLITPLEVAEFDTTYLCDILEITKNDLEIRIKKASDYSRYKPSILVKQIPPETYAVLQEKLYKFHGFHTQSRTLREYAYPAAAHVLGYVGEVTPGDIANDTYYKMGDYIGATGIENSYEAYLRGKKGVKKYLVDVHNRIKGNYLAGREDVPAEIGSNITSSLDIDLQLYAEKLMQNKKGSIVAIEPATGEILALASSPSYDPGLLVGRVRGKNFAALSTDTLQPLYSRALMAKYPPGSTFKILNVLVALQEETINTRTKFSCAGTASKPIRCTHSHVSPLNAVQAVKESCNPFLWNTFRTIINKPGMADQGYNMWRDYVLKFGMGRKLDTDLIIENKGFVPEVDYYNRYFGEHRWSALTIRSLSIGQGELGVTPLQLANFAAIVANRGYYHIPHVIKNVENESLDSRFKRKNYAGIDTVHFNPVIEGMQRVVENSNASVYMKIPGITMCGKTGTAQNPHGKDHSIFMAFAPKDDPKIAISVYVENSGYGAVWAAPIASLLVEEYLT
ncbi:MAG: penicillin-binding protein 2, partial [Bacteroidota bacterium]